MRGQTNKREVIDFKTDYYGALKLIDWFDIDRVRAARILVIGAGAIGNEVLKNLALLGIGHIYIIDRDTIEMSNLSRSILYRAADNEQPKAATAARVLREINPDIKVQWQNGDIQFDLGLGLVRRMDVVIGCLDNRAARLKMNTDCYKINRPWIDAGIGQLNGQVRVFYPGAGACYECSFTEEDYQQVAMPCNRLASMYASEGKIPTTPTIASIVAGVQVQEALKLLDMPRWQGRTLAGQEFIFNGTVGDVSISTMPEREDCPAHGAIEPEQLIELREVSANSTTVAQLLDAVEHHLGCSATVELNFELAVELKCLHPQCRASTPVLKPRNKLFQEQLVCTQCGNEGKLESTHMLNRNDPQHYSALMKLTLAELNVPPLDILAARTTDGAEWFFELTGDEEEIFRNPT